MQRRCFLKLFGAGTLLALAPGLIACTNYEGRGVWYRYPYAYYDYYYYPDINVYYHLYSGHYYYPRYGIWVRSRRLPDYYHLNPIVRRRLVIRHPHPYERNLEHRREWERHLEQERLREVGREEGRTELRRPAQNRQAPEGPEPRFEPGRQPPAERRAVRADSQLGPEQRRIGREERPRIESDTRRRTGSELSEDRDRQREIRGEQGPTRLRRLAEDRATPETGTPLEPRRRPAVERPAARADRPDQSAQRRISTEERRRIESESRQRRAREPEDWPPRRRSD